jgi:hypothetical protein
VVSKFNPNRESSPPTLGEALTRNPGTGLFAESLMSRAALSFASSSSAPSHKPLPLGAVTVRTGDPALHRRVLPILASGKAFVLLTADPPVAPDALRAPPADSSGKTCQVMVLRCTPALDTDALLAACCGALAVPAGADRAARLRAIVARLLRQSRDGLTAVLLLEDAGSLGDEVLENIHRLFRLDERCLLPVVLVAKPDFLGRLQGDGLAFLREAIAAHLRLEPAAAPASPPAATAAKPSTAGHAAPATPSERESAQPATPTARDTVAHAAAAADSFAALAGQASQLLKDLEGRTPAAAPVPASRLAEEGGDLATLLRRLSSAPAATPASAADGPGGTAAPTAATPSARPAAPKVKMPVAAAPKPDAPGRDAAEPAAAPRRRLGIGALVAASLYVIASIVVGGGAVLLWQTGRLVPSAERIDQVAAFFAAQSGRIGALIASTTNREIVPGPSAAAPATDNAAEPGGAETPTDMAEPIPPAPEPLPMAGATEAVAETEATAAEIAEPQPPEEAPTAAAPESAPIEAAAAPAAPPSAPAEPAVQVAAIPAPPPIAPARATPPASVVTPAQVEQFRKRGDQVLATGDVAAARLFYQWAAEAGDARGALAFAKTHDPLFLAELRARGVMPDRAKAVQWYRAASERGSSEAGKRLEALLEMFPQAGQ